MAAPSPPVSWRPPVAEETPAGEEGSSAGRASSPEDLLTVYAAQELRPVPAQVGSIVEGMCCLLLLSSFSVLVVLKNRKQEVVVDIHSKFLHGAEVHKLLYVIDGDEGQL